MDERNPQRENDEIGREQEEDRATGDSDEFDDVDELDEESDEEDFEE